MRAEITVLQDLGAQKGLIYGAAISAEMIDDDVEFVEFVLCHAGAVVAENDMK